MNDFKTSLFASAVGATMCALLLAGCAAGTRYRIPSGDNALATDALRRNLDRWVGWKSLTARVKLTVSNQDSSVSARGHLIYLLGERYELGFKRPFNRFLGNFYVTPTQTIYWDLNATPKVLSSKDTTSLADLLPVKVPNWDPRDLLPFPMSGRSSGLQADSVWREAGEMLIMASSEGVAYRMTVSTKKGTVEQEWISRFGRDPVIKTYQKFREINGWPVHVRVRCTDTSGIFSLSWTLGGIELQSEPYNLPQDSLVPGISG